MEENTSSKIPTQESEAQPRSARVVVCILAMLSTIAAWVCTAYNARAAIAVSLVAVILSIVGMSSGRRCLRILSTTMLIASATLLVVVAAFIIAVLLTI